jgi:hypothetical protein
MITSQPWGKWNYSLTRQKVIAACAIAARWFGRSTDANSRRTWKQKRATLDFWRSAQLISMLHCCSLLALHALVFVVFRPQNPDRGTRLWNSTLQAQAGEIHNKYILRERSREISVAADIIASCQFLAGNSCRAEIGSWDCQCVSAFNVWLII